MSGYTRQDILDEIADSAVVKADPLDAEFDALAAAFSTISGHTHNGEVGTGAPITVVGPSQDVVITTSTVTPKTTNTVSLGNPTYKFKDLLLSGSFSALTGQINGSDITTAANAQTLTNKTISGGVITGITDLAVADGGTGASTAISARANLGLSIGTNVQAQSPNLQAIAGVTSAADTLPYFTGSGTAAVATITSAARTLLSAPDTNSQRVALGAQPVSAKLSNLSGLSMAANDLFYATSSSNFAVLRPSAPTQLLGVDNLNKPIWRDSGDFTNHTLLLDATITAGVTEYTSSSTLFSDGAPGSFWNTITILGLNIGCTTTAIRYLSFTRSAAEIVGSIPEPNPYYHVSVANGTGFTVSDAETDARSFKLVLDEVRTTTLFKPVSVQHIVESKDVGPPVALAYDNSLFGFKIKVLSGTLTGGRVLVYGSNRLW